MLWTARIGLVAPVDAIVVENKYSFPPPDKVKEYVADPSMLAAVAAALVATACSSAGSTTKGEEKDKPAEESNEDMGFNLFD
ncbi:hypothetical protein FXO38_19077 [Capsicum annuum]|nr:hypothetical protein FXO38_19077 [Capsicum annuum]